MDYVLDQFEQQVRAAIAATGQVPASQVELTAPKPNIPADLAFPTFKAAKTLGLPPPQLAQALAQAIPTADEALIGAVAAAGLDQDTFRHEFRDGPLDDGLTQLGLPRDGAFAAPDA